MSAGRQVGLVGWSVGRRLGQVLTPASQLHVDILQFPLSVINSNLLAIIIFCIQPNLTCGLDPYASRSHWPFAACTTILQSSLFVLKFKLTRVYRLSTK